jgi:alkanesulfonate monooxygenase SsuD/methylene tetrahydromethanopterin reductase-like flavin-dependent oxidoreductase (luciferase family)
MPNCPTTCPRRLRSRVARAASPWWWSWPANERLTVRQLLVRLGTGRGHHTVVGTPEQVAASLHDWWSQGAADGFNVMPAVLPAGLRDFVDQVVPLLQKRGVFRTEYTGHTLRDHYGLSRPPNQYVGRLD